MLKATLCQHSIEPQDRQCELVAPPNSTSGGQVACSAYLAKTEMILLLFIKNKVSNNTPECGRHALTLKSITTITQPNSRGRASRKEPVSVSGSDIPEEIT
jgi:hypothetical protein